MKRYIEYKFITPIDMISTENYTMYIQENDHIGLLKDTGESYAGIAWEDVDLILDDFNINIKKDMTDEEFDEVCQNMETFNLFK